MTYLSSFHLKWEGFFTAVKWTSLSYCFTTLVSSDSLPRWFSKSFSYVVSQKTSLNKVFETLLQQREKGGLITFRLMILIFSILGQMYKR